jgi:hypothetical protein
MYCRIWGRWRNEGNPWRVSVRIEVVPPKIRTGYISKQIHESRWGDRHDMMTFPHDKKKSKLPRKLSSWPTFGDENVDGRRLRVGGTASVVARVGVVGVANGQTTLRLGARLRLHRNAASWCIVVDHAVVVVPEHVLRWGGTLQRKSDGEHEAVAWTLQTSYFACNTWLPTSMEGTGPAYVNNINIFLLLSDTENPSQ